MNSLVNYSSDSEEEKSEPEEIPNICTTNKVSQRLPVPGCLLNNLKKDEVADNPCENEGRIRSFPHQRGNWASHVYIPYEGEEEMSVLCERLIEACCECETEVKAVPSPHVSLTRTFVLLYHWIQEFVSTVKTSVSSLTRFRLELRDIDVYVNDEGTRTFLGLTVASGYSSMAEAVRILDSCLKQYNLKPFYEEGRYHMSVCWCLGNRQQYFLSIMPRLRQAVASFFLDYPESSSVDVTQLVCKTGNRIYKFDLNS